MPREKEPTRILVGKQDEATVVAEQLIDAETDTLIFSIPRGSVFSQSLNNFKLLKREGDVLGKEIIIESEDVVVRERAAKAGLEIGEQAPVDSDEQEQEDARPIRGSRSLRVKVSSDDEAPVEAALVRRAAKSRRRVDEDPVPSEEKEVSRSSGGREPLRQTRSRSSFWSRKRMLTVGLLAAGIGLIVYLSLVVWPRATLTLELVRSDWKLSGLIVIDKSVARVDVTTGKIPGQIFTQKSTATTVLPATGEQLVDQKANGTLTIYNAYSSQPQNIVASTRFVTPSGVVFRTTKSLTIPGAKIDHGAVIPSSVTTMVVADQAGPAGNVGATPKLTIPGFAKTPKYNGFYGELQSGTSGGSSGRTKIATDGDIKAAKIAGAQEAERLVRNQILTQVPSGFRMIDPATQFVVLRQTVNPIADAKGMFTVATEGQLSVLAFRDEDVKGFLLARRSIESASSSMFSVEKEKLTYGAPTAGAVQLAIGRMSLPIIYSATLTAPVDADQLKTKVAGMPGAVLKTIIAGTPGIKKGSIDFWPFYVRTVPTNPAKITITLQ